MLRVKGLNIDVLRGKTWINAVENVNFTVGEAEILGIIGESGSGKTLTAKAIAHILPENMKQASGEISLEGKQLELLTKKAWRTIYGKELSFIFQNPMTALNPVKKVGAQIVDTFKSFHACTFREAKAEAIHVLDQVGIKQPETVFHSYPHELSGGMKQRVMIAIAVINKPKLIIADEPTTALDATVKKEILDLFLKLRRELNVSIIFISHDIGAVSYLCDKILVLYGGKPVEQGPFSMLMAPAHPYTKALLEAVPEINGTRKLKGIPGSVPGLDDKLAGCIFAPRCSSHQSICDEKQPVLSERNDAHTFYCHNPLQVGVK